MTLNDKNIKAKSDWNNLAKDALDLWQNHLTSLASDPKAKEELAQLVGPMGKMFSDWTEMVQQSMGGAKPDTKPDMKVSTSPIKEAPIAQDGDKDKESSALDIPETPQDFADQAVVPEAKTVVLEAAPAEVNSIEDTSPEDMQAAVTPLKDTFHEPESSSTTKSTEVGPTAESAPVPVAPAVKSPDGGRTVSSGGHRDMVELADRLAFLERELAELRSKKHAGPSGEHRPDSDSLSQVDQDVQSVAGVNKGSTSF